MIRVPKSSLEEAHTFAPEAGVGDIVMVPTPDPTRKFGRIAAQTAKQVILQKIREAERESLYDEYVEREGDLISGTVQSVSAQGVTISLGRAEALLPRAHMMPGERYKPHDKVRTYLLEVKKGNRGPQIIVSRSHRNMLRRLLEYEVPEIYNGQVEIKNIAREAGFRSKVAVAALQEGVDPVGACVGMRGIRIQNIVRELSEEKIDVIEWSADSGVYITKALSPARVSGVYLDEYADTGRGGLGTATVIVPDDQLSLAIGREGQNARLAAKLTGWRIDIKSVTESAVNALANTESKLLKQLHDKNTELVEEVQRILAKRDTGRPVMPEEFQTLTQYARQAEQALLEERRLVNKKHQDHLKGIRDALPQHAFDLDVNTENLPLPAAVVKALAARFETLGDIMLYLQVDEERVTKALERVNLDDALSLVKKVLETLEIPEPVEVEGRSWKKRPKPSRKRRSSNLRPWPSLKRRAPVAEEAAVEAEEDEMLPAIVEPEPEPEVIPVKAPPAAAKPEAAPEPAPAPERELAAQVYEPVSDENIDDFRTGQKDKKSKQLRRQLVFDETAGKVVAKRKRKGSRKRQSFFDMDEEEI